MSISTDGIITNQAKEANKRLDDPIPEYINYINTNEPIINQKIEEAKHKSNIHEKTVAELAQEKAQMEAEKRAQREAVMNNSTTDGFFDGPGLTDLEGFGDNER